MCADIFLSIPTMKVPTHTHTLLSNGWILCSVHAVAAQSAYLHPVVSAQLRIKFIYYTNIGNAFCMQMGKNAYDYPNDGAIRSETAARTQTTALLRMFVFHLCNAFCHLIYYSRWELNFREIPQRELEWRNAEIRKKKIHSYICVQGLVEHERVIFLSASNGEIADCTMRLQCVLNTNDGNKWINEYHYRFLYLRIVRRLKG